MIPMGAVAAGIYGAWMLARRRPEGLNWFDATPEGFWRSFWAAVVVAPGFVVLELITGGFGEGFSLGSAVVQLIAYVIDWVAFPLLMVFVADRLGCWPNYIRYIVAYNWSSVVQMAVLLPAALLAVLVPSAPTLMLMQGITIILLVYRAYVAHVALGVGLGSSAGIVLMDVLLSGVTKVLSDRLIGG